MVAKISRRRAPQNLCSKRRLVIGLAFADLISRIAHIPRSIVFPVWFGDAFIIPSFGRSHGHRSQKRDPGHSPCIRLGRFSWIARPALYLFRISRSRNTSSPLAAFCWGKYIWNPIASLGLQILGSPPPHLTHRRAEEDRRAQERPRTNICFSSASSGRSP